MALPSIPIPKKYVEVGDEKVEIRGLSYALALRMQTMKNVEESGIFVIARGFNISDAEAKEWCENTPAAIVDEISDEILKLSGLMPDFSEQESGKSTEDKLTI